MLSVLLNEFGEETVRFRVTVSLPFSMLLILPPSPTSLSLSLYLSRFLSGGCHHGDSTVRMLQYEDQEGCSLSPMATASIRCEHCVAHTTSPPTNSLYHCHHPVSYRSPLSPLAPELRALIPPSHTCLDIIITQLPVY